MESKHCRALWAALPVIGATLCTTVGANPPDLQRAPVDGAMRQSQPAGSSHPGERVGGDMRASQVIGMEVEDRAGRRVGNIEDVIIDMREGRAAYALLAAGQNAEVGGQRVALPFTELGGTVKRDRMVLHMDHAQLRTYPTFRQRDEPDWNQIHERLGDGDRAPAGQVDGLRRFRGASRLLQADLRDRTGKVVGDVEDFVLNLRTGEVRYGVAEFDPSLMERGKLVVIPVTNIESEVGGDDLVVHVDRARLRDAMSFDRNRWPDVDEPGFRARLGKFIGSVEGYADPVDEKAGG